MTALTEHLASDSRLRMGRKRINHEQTPARLPKGTLARMDAVLADGEKRADFIREAVSRELDRRETDDDTKEPRE